MSEHASPCPGSKAAPRRPAQQAIHACPVCIFASRIPLPPTSRAITLCSTPLRMSAALGPPFVGPHDATTSSRTDFRTRADRRPSTVPFSNITVLSRTMEVSRGRAPTARKFRYACLSSSTKVCRTEASMVGPPSLRYGMPSRHHWRSPMSVTMAGASSPSMCSFPCFIHMEAPLRTNAGESPSRCTKPSEYHVVSEFSRSTTAGKSPYLCTWP
jgi:hypothetical protein